MSRKSVSPLIRLAPGLAAASLAAAALTLAWHGGIDPSSWVYGPPPTERAAQSLGRSGDEELEVPVGLLDEQSEPDLLETQATAADSLDDSTLGDLAAEDQEPAIVAANFEDTAGEGSAGSLAGSGPTSRGEAARVPLRQIDELERQGNLVAAQRELSRWFWESPAERDAILPRLDRMAQSLYFAPQPHFHEPYVIGEGDQLRTIGRKYKLSWEYLARLNRADPRRIRGGQKLKVVPGPFAAHVSVSRYELVVHLGGSYVKSYRVGVGRDGTTPLGTFAVKNKLVDPTYYGPEGVIAHDDPENPLGERWIDIGDSYGIHGTIEPESIGKSESRGCIRMLNSDVEEVYDFLVPGSEVTIVR